MRSLAFLGGIAAFTSAQLMPLNEIAKLPVPANQGPTVGKGAGKESHPYDANAVFQSTYNSVFSKGATTAKRNIFQARHDGGDCSPQPLGAGPSVNPDTPEAFTSNAAFAAAANGAQTPSGWVNTFKNLQASSQVPMGYLGYDSVSSYDPSICAAKCDALSGCFAFDLYFERDPTIDPGDNCPNPSSTTIIKCAYWGTTLESDTATNDGQYCADFHIVIAGSNGYVRKQAGITIPGYTGSFTGDTAINAPTECNSYIGYELFNDGQPFDPARCAAACKATSQYNIQYLNSRAICRFFDTYILSKNGVPQGQYCAMYTRSWDTSYATNNGQTDDQDNKYTISYSYMYSNSTDPGAQVCDAKCMSQSPCPGSGNSSSSATTTVLSTTVSSTSFSSTTLRFTTSTSQLTSSTTRSTSFTSSQAPSTSSGSTTTSSSLTTSPSLTTTFQTSTIRTTTFTSKTTSTSTQPTSTQNTQCFRLRPSNPSFKSSPVPQYLSLNAQTSKLILSTTPSTFTLDAHSRLTTSSKPISRTIENWFSPWYGSLSTNGISSVTCSKQGTQLVCAGSLSASSVWVNGGQVMHGNCPGSGWEVVTLGIEGVECPKDQGQDGSQGDVWKGFMGGFGFGW